MKKRHYPALTIILACMFSLCGCIHKAEGDTNSLSCTVTNLPSSELIIFECEEVTLNGIKIKLTNVSGKDIVYGRGFTVECLVNDEWEQCDILTDSTKSTFTDDGIILKTSGSLSVDWSKIYGTLKQGKYRLILSTLSYWDGEPKIVVEAPIIEFIIQ